MTNEYQMVEFIDTKQKQERKRVENEERNSIKETPYFFSALPNSSNWLVDKKKYDLDYKLE